MLLVGVGDAARCCSNKAPSSCSPLPWSACLWACPAVSVAASFVSSAWLARVLLGDRRLLFEGFLCFPPDFLEGAESPDFRRSLPDPPALLVLRPFSGWVPPPCRSCSLGTAGRRYEFPVATIPSASDPSSVLSVATIPACGESCPLEDDATRERDSGDPSSRLTAAFQSPVDIGVGLSGIEGWTGD